MMKSQIAASLLLNSFFSGSFDREKALQNAATGLKLPGAPALPFLTLNLLQDGGIVKESRAY